MLEKVLHCLSIKWCRGGGVQITLPPQLPQLFGCWVHKLVGRWRNSDRTNIDEREFPIHVV